MFEDNQVDDNILLNMSCEKLEFVWNIEIIFKQSAILIVNIDQQKVDYFKMNLK